MKRLKQTLWAPLYMLFAGAMVVSSCMNEADPFGLSPAKQEAEEEGVGSFEVLLQGNNATRATTTVSADEAKKYWITIYKGTDVYTPATQLGGLSNRLNAGFGYSLMAESILESEAESENQGWGKRRYMGKSQSFAIIAGETTKVNVSCKVANGGVSAYFDNTITDNFTNYSITINEKYADGEARNFTFNSTNCDHKVNDVIQSGQVAYFNIPATGRSIEYTVTAGSVTKTFTQELEVAKIKRLSVSYKSGSFTLEIDVEDEEIYADDNITVEPDPSISDKVPTITTENKYENGELVGTELTATDPSYYAGTTVVTEWSAVVKNADGETIRTISPAKGTLTSGANDTNWPYLPVGNYVFEYTFENFKGIVETKTITFNITEQPNFQVSLNALTSYSYATGDGTTVNITQANACENNKIYAPTVTVTGISNALAQNAKYGLSTTFKGQTQQLTKTAVYADYTESELKSYDLSATATFAGRTLSATKKVHITGIPYASKPPTTSNGWYKTNGTVRWRDDYVQLADGAEASEQRIAKSFYVPGNVNVSAYVKADTQAAISPVGNTFIFKIAGEERISKSTSGLGSDTIDETVAGTLTSNNMTIECSNSYGLGATHSRVYEVNVNYR